MGGTIGGKSTRWLGGRKEAVHKRYTVELSSQSFGRPEDPGASLEGCAESTR